jgi:hypothetical protein
MSIEKIDAFFESWKMDRKKVIYFFLIAFVFFAIISVSRRIDSVTHPQFWAEDGIVWYSNAYHMGPFAPFLIPVSGYFQTISRIGAAVSLLFPLRYAPLIFNIFAICIQILPALFFLTRRFNNVVSSTTMRLAIGFAYLALPFTFETHINLSNAQWRLSVLLFLIIIAKSDRRILWKIFDIFFLVLAGLSGPFSIVAAPIAVYYFLKYTNRHFIYKTLIVCSTGLIQLISALVETAHNARGQVHLGVSLPVFLKILAGKVFITGLFGALVYGIVWKSSWWASGYVAAITAIIGTVMIVYAFRKSQPELKLFIAYAYGVFLLALIFPMVSNTDVPEWESMLHPAGGNRYLFLPILAWIMALVWIYFRAQKFEYIKNFAAILLCLFAFIGIPLSWKITPFKDYHFADQARQFEKIPSGQSMNFKINPCWNMTLIKK